MIPFPTGRRRGRSGRASLAARVRRQALVLDAWRFGAHRADYYDYLQAVLRGAQGRLTIRELFDHDARRYGARTVRGRLSDQWARRCEASGGDLHATWLGSFPRDELALIRVAQEYGNTRLLCAFQALGEHLGLLNQARDLLWATLGVAAVAVLLLAALLPVIAWWTIPAVQQAFQGLPEHQSGPWAQSLLSLGQHLRLWGIWLLALLPGGLVLAVHALPRASGPWRDRLDQFGPWRLYRLVQAMRILSLVSILLQPGAGGSSQLRPVMVVFLEEASPWLAHHLARMVMRIDQGLTGAAAFDTGLMDQELYWYFEDMVAALGLQEGLQAVHRRMVGRWMRRMQSQAQTVRWLVLLGGVATVLSLGLWHYTAIDELRRSWMMFHAAA